MGKKNKYSKMPKPSAILYYPIATGLLTFYRLKNKVTFNNDDKKLINGGAVVLSTHPSFNDFIHVAMAVYPNRITVVGNRFYANIRGLNTLLRWLSVIPKRLFAPDLDTIKGMLSAAKSGHVVLMMPEGRLSADGTNFQVTDGTARLIKKMGVDVFTAHCEGAYFGKPRWAKAKRRSRLNVNLNKLVDKADLKNMSVDELESKIVSSMTYDDKVIELISCKDRTKGLEDIVNICPDCGRTLTLKAENHCVTCTQCGYNVFMDEQCNFTSGHFRTIKEWYAFQGEKVAEYVENISLKADVKLTVQSTEKSKFIEAGEGVFSLNTDTITYDGSVYGEHRHIEIPVENVEAMPFSITRGLQLYIDNDLFMFLPERNSKQMVFWSQAVDILTKKRKLL